MNEKDFYEYGGDDDDLKDLPPLIPISSNELINCGKCGGDDDKYYHDNSHHPNHTHKKQFYSKESGYYKKTYPGGQVKMFYEKKVYKEQLDAHYGFTTSFKGNPCSFCGKVQDAVITCQKCQQVVYCTVHCQRSHWRTTHKKYCKTMLKIRIKKITKKEMTLFMNEFDLPHLFGDEDNLHSSVRSQLNDFVKEYENDISDDDNLSEIGSNESFISENHKYHKEGESIDGLGLGLGLGLLAVAGFGLLAFWGPYGYRYYGYRPQYLRVHYHHHHQRQRQRQRQKYGGRQNYGRRGNPSY